LEQSDLNKRLLIALVLSAFVFIGYSYIMPTSVATEKTIQPNSNKAPLVQSPTNTPAQSSANTVAVPVVQNGKIISTIKSKSEIITIDEFGRIAQVTLLDKKYEQEDGTPLPLLNPAETKPLELRFADTTLNSEAFKTPYSADRANIELDSTSQTVILTQKLATITITKTISFNQNGSYKIGVKTSSPINYFITPGYRTFADKTQYMVAQGALIVDSDDIITTIEDGDAAGSESFKNAKIVSAFDRYYTSLFYSSNPKQLLQISIMQEKNDNPLIFVQGSSDLQLDGYIGAKEYNKLKSINPELTNVIEYGWFTFLAKPFFKVISWIHDYVGNWGWAIVLFTILVKIILFPLSYKGMLSMQKLKDLAPKMKDIKEKYKGDSAKMNMKMMELYKNHGANPLGGCLPLLLQIPIFFALYRVLLNADELQGAEWILWINNLAVMDPYWVLPILMGITMYYQQKITPSNFTDPLQEKIFKFFPVLMTVFFISFPAGLVLYWLTNNILTIAQQYYINKVYDKHKALNAHK